ncbi:MAG: P-loop NTPase [Chloroflexota bacterium]|nr:P-loop NTPase [Chloroflexota bacterium]
MTENTHQVSGSDLRDFLRPIWRHRWLVAAVVVATTVATYVYNERKPDRFRSSTQIFLQASDIDQALFGLGGPLEGDRNIVNQANLLQTPAVAREVAERINFQGDPAVLLDAIEVTPSTGSDFLVVSAVAGTPRRAAQLANAFAAAFINLRAATTREDIERALDTARRQLARLPDTTTNSAARETLRTRISSLEAIRSVSPGGARQVDRAEPAAAPFAPQPRRAALFGFALSLVLAMLAAYGLERADRRVRHLDEIDPTYGAPVLAALPHLPGSMISRSNGNAPEVAPAFREAVRGLRTNLRLASPDTPLRTFLVTSALPGEGKSTLVLNLALAYAESGLRVAVIECDLRLPSLPRLIAVKPSPGLTDVLAGEVELAAAVQAVEVGSPAAATIAAPATDRAPTGAWALEPPNLTVLTAGAQPADPSSLLATQRMKRILESARADADVVLIDTPPLLSVADALPLLGSVDATILVARIGVANRSAGRRVQDIIERIPGASLLGVVANDVPVSEFAGDYYGYGAAYGAVPDRPRTGSS